MYVLAPSIYAADYMKLGKQIRILERLHVKRLHIDVMDGHFVPNLSFGPDLVHALKCETDMELDVHLMIEQPMQFLRVFADAGADIITVHYEACENAVEALEMIHSFGKQAGIALKPETELHSLPEKLWTEMNILQVMTVAPGLKEQRFMPEMLLKIKEARDKIQAENHRIQIEADGAITTEWLREALQAGIDAAVVGKALFCGDLEENVKNYLFADKKAEMFN